jgi:hypothetical protein
MNDFPKQEAISKPSMKAECAYTNPFCARDEVVLWKENSTEK